VAKSDNKKPQQQPQQSPPKEPKQPRTDLMIKRDKGRQGEEKRR
jgi:hypothetical protein